MSTCTHFALLNKLNTLDRVRKGKSNVSRTDGLCKNSDEMRDRLFFKCEYSKIIRTRIKQHFNIDDLLYLMNAILNNHGKDKHQNNVIDALVITVWHIWCERSSRLFSKTKMSYQARSELIKQDIPILVSKSKSR